MIRRHADIAQRLDQLRARFEAQEQPEASGSAEIGAPSSSLTEAVDRLERALLLHAGEQEATSEVADRLLAALDVIPQGIVLADGAANVVYRNQVAESFADDARHSDALVQPAIAELVAGAVAGRSETRTIELYGPPRRVIQLRALPLGAADGGEGRELPGAFLVADDVSDRHRLEAVRRDFVANISHELKTPVGAMGLLAETLAGEDDPAVVHRLAARMQREAFRVADTIEDLLQLSQIEAGALPSREQVAVDTVVADAIDRTRPAAELASVRLRVEVPPRPLSIFGDRRQLTSAVANLCDNAVKYSDPGDEVVIRARAVNGSVEVDVADHGIGIPTRDLARVFERFYRVDRARSRETGGTGLGLAIVRHVVQNHEGEVRVSSQEGEGSTFTLTLPASPVPASA